jgi:DNA repair protein RecO (recombination protein O)
VARTETTSAVLLRSVAYGDADRIVTLLTDAHGKVAVLARSARKSKKRFPPGALEPFGIIEAEIALGGGEVGRLASARLARGFPGILASLSKMELAGAALEIARELAPPRGADPRFVPTVEAFFARVEEGAEAEARLAFELRFLALAGLPPRLDACGRCGLRAEDRAALFDPAIGAIVCRADGGGPIHLGASTRAKMIACLREGWVEASRGWSDVERREADEAIEEFVRRHLGRARMELR